MLAALLVFAIVFAVACSIKYGDPISNAIKLAKFETEKAKAELLIYNGATEEEISKALARAKTPAVRAMLKAVLAKKNAERAMEQFGARLANLPDS